MAFGSTFSSASRGAGLRLTTFTCYRPGSKPNHRPPDGDWYKDFGSFLLCGSGEYPKTVLAKGMKPFGKEIQ